MSSAAPGQPIVYTLTVMNTGHVAYPAAPMADAAGFSDDLSDITDDASLVPGSLGASAGTAAVVGHTLSWTGPLPVGSPVTVTFQVRLDNPDHGNRKLANDIQPTGPGAVAVLAGGPAAPWS